MKLPIAIGVLIGSLAFTAPAAMAMSPVHPSAKAARVARPRVAKHAVTRQHSAARNHTPERVRVDVGQFIQSMLGGGWPVPAAYANLVRDAMRASAARGSAAVSDYSPSYDMAPSSDTSAAVDNRAAASQAAADAAAESQAIQQMNDTNALTASMAAAQAQNDADTAATMQTEINAGM